MVRPSPAISCSHKRERPILPSRPAILASCQNGLAWRSGGRFAICNPPPGGARSIARGRIAPWQNFCLSTLASLSCCRHLSEHNRAEAAPPALGARSVSAAGTGLQILILQRELRELRELLSERISAYPAITAYREGPSKRRGSNEGTRLGRPATVADDAAKVQTIRATRAAGKSIRTIAREQGLGIGTVSRLTG